MGLRLGLYSRTLVRCGCTGCFVGCEAVGAEGAVYVADAEAAVLLLDDGDVQLLAEGDVVLLVD